MLHANGTVTHILAGMPGGGESFDSLLGAVYGELRRLARSHLRRERDGHTLTATALVHEAWLRLIGPNERRFENRAHFFGAVSQAMRRVLVDHARGWSARKRGAERVALTSADDVAAADAPLHDLLAIDAALGDLQPLNPRLVRIVECRYFAGLTIVETAEALGVSHATVAEDWRFARAWLRQALSAPSSDARVANGKQRTI